MQLIGSRVLVRVMPVLAVQDPCALESEATVGMEGKDTATSEPTRTVRRLDHIVDLIKPRPVPDVD
jgi:hypothetical protein